MLAHVLHFSYQVELYTQISIGPIVMLISVLWLVYFFKQARTSLKQWRVNQYLEEGLKRKIIFHKSVLIVTLLVSDIVICGASFSESISYFFKPGNLTLELNTFDCEISKYTWLASVVYERYHSSTIIEGVWQCGVLAEFCVFIALLKYFICIYTQSNPSLFQKNRTFSIEKNTLIYLVTIAPQTIMIICFDTSPNTIMIGQLIFGILASMYWVITAVSAKTLFKTLKWYKADMKHEFSDIQLDNLAYNLRLYRWSIIFLLGVTSLFITVELCYILCNVWIGTFLTNNCWFRAHFPFIGHKYSFSLDTISIFKKVTYALIILRNLTVLLFMIFIVILNVTFLIAEKRRRMDLASKWRSRTLPDSITKPLLK